MDGVGAPDRLRVGLGQAVGEDLPLFHQLRERSGGLLDGGRRIGAVLVVQVDAVRVQAPEGSLDGESDVLGAPVVAADAALEVAEHTELRGEHRLVADPLQRAPDELFVGVGAVDLGRVDERAAELDGAADRPDGFGVVLSGAGVERGHAHATQADDADVDARRAQCRLLQHEGVSHPSV